MYKSDLRSFLTQSVADPTILSRLNWQDYKQNIVGQLVDFLTWNEEVYQRQLMGLMTDVARVRDRSHLARLDDGQTKVNQAQAAAIPVPLLRIARKDLMYQVNISRLGGG